MSPSSIDLSSRALRYLAGHLTSRRQEIGTRWRRLAPGRQALLALAHLWCGDTYAQLAAGFGIGIATAFRYIREAVDVLAALAPSPAEAMKRIQMKHKRHGMNVQVPTDPFGHLLRASPALPGSTHDLTAARHHGITKALAEADLKCWADKAYQGTGGPVRVPFRGRRLKRWKRRHNTTHATIRCPGERAMATLKGWRLLRKLRCSTNRITDVVKAVVVLHHVST
ncbi:MULTISPECIES: transposase family protein [unclassified Streptomyces]|uniref:transposase family protein n=1 Tax=unclassified Streptomyces TaxID=2593676 RepID=UPI000DAE8854|nr:MULTISPECIES: transposase family protein [unclassified Streptomyces]PZT75910.1 IS5/IS1182 family transposase [Streptomyces sp. AC1-42W]PZT80140.1 IS5/IS1182 family transposase [Streptomyces sp. AC1-42T]